MATVLALPAADTWGMHGDVGTGWMIGMSVMMVVFWGLIILGIVWVIRGVAGGTSTQRDTPVRESAVEILERRFAEGAITPEDYRARREILARGEPATEGRR
ncbi:MAG TPA: SHOCT domain-containing protein [Gaiellaceae bacterium]|nr:SHOCT domain-containing protein [Gaiellaceae bacterium]